MPRVGSYDEFRLDAELLQQSERAFGIRFKNRYVVLPRSQVRVVADAPEGIFRFIAPRWLLENRSLPTDEDSRMYSGATLAEWREVGEDPSEGMGYDDDFGEVHQ